MEYTMPCGCSVSYEGDYFKPDWGIEFCPLHATAPALLEAAQGIKAWKTDHMTWDAIWVRIEHLEVAIALATGG